MTLYFYAILALVLLVLGLAMYIAIARLPGFTKKREQSNVEDEPHQIHLKFKPDYEFGAELRTDAHGTVVKKFEDYEIPWGYGDNKIVLMTKDPHWLFTYWELTDQRKDKLKEEFGDEIFTNSYPVLRVYDKTKGHTYIYSEITINDYARSWYINVHSDCSYQVILGRKTHGGLFVPILESNLVNTPRERMSSSIDENWPPIPGMDKYYNQFSFNEVLSSPDSQRKE